MKSWIVLAGILLFNWPASALAETLNLTALEWPPYYSSNLPGNGFFTALVREAYKRAGYEIEVTFVPWKRALETARAGSYDGLVGAYYTDDRAKDFSYSEQVAANEEVFIHLRTTDIPYRSPEDLRGIVIGVLDGAAQSQRLQAEGFVVESSSTFDTNLKKLQAKRLPVILVGRQFLSHVIHSGPDMEMLKEQIRVMEPPYASYNLYSLISRKRPDAESITRKFNLALDEMKSDGTYMKILQDHGQPLLLPQKGPK